MVVSDIRRHQHRRLRFEAPAIQHAPRSLHSAELDQSMTTDARLGPDTRPADILLAYRGTRAPTSSPAACLVTRNGTSRRARWRGKANRSPRFALRSRIPSATADEKSKT